MHLPLILILQTSNGLFTMLTGCWSRSPATPKCNHAVLRQRFCFNLSPPLVPFHPPPCGILLPAHTTFFSCTLFFSSLIHVVFVFYLFILDVSFTLECGYHIVECLKKSGATQLPPSPSHVTCHMPNFKTYPLSRFLVQFHTPSLGSYITRGTCGGVVR